MFTGIVEEIGTVTGWKQGPEVCQLTIDCQVVLQDARVGHSIAVNGVCLTAADIREGSFTADILVESLAKTALKKLQVGSSVNLERALQVGGRLGGHWVTGHIDGVGELMAIRRERNSLWYTLELPADLLKYMVPKGSIALDGVSLTIAKLQGNQVVVSLIPHTADQTIFGKRKPGDLVNVEGDVLGKYVYKMLGQGQSEPDGISKETLEKYGFA